MTAFRRLIVSLVLASSSCVDAPAYYYGENLSEVRFVLWSLDLGVHPSRAVLDDPNNPFRFYPPSAEMKWQLLTYGGDAAAFYAWATLLAEAPTGELQYYTATLLERIERNRGITEVERPYVRRLSLEAYAAVLDHFPDDVTYDASGRFAYRLAPLAYDGILGLGGTPPPGWMKVATPDGGTTVIRIDEEGL